MVRSAEESAEAGWATDSCSVHLTLPQEAVAVQLEPQRLVKILEVLQELPAPNYRCVGLHFQHPAP